MATATKTAGRKTSGVLETMTVKVTGASPLVMHNPRMSDPLDPATRALAEFTSKTKKTIQDHERIAELEWEGCLYHDDVLGPFVPAEWVMKSMVQGARLFKYGASIERGLLIHPEFRLCPLTYDGPRDIDGLRGDGRFRLRRSANANPSSSRPSRTMRTRPIFEEWSVDVTFIENSEYVDRDRVQKALELSGAMIGMGDGRSIGFGRYIAEIS